MKYILYIFIFLVSCDMQEEWMLDVPSFGQNSLLVNVTSLTPQTIYAMEGIYKVVRGREVFGDTLVVKRTRDKISFFGLKDGIYCILDAGSKNQLIVLEGYWRCARTSATGLVRFMIQNASGLLNGDTTLSVSMTGFYGFSKDIPKITTELKLVKRLSFRLRNDPFIIGAHRGGGRTSDRLPVSENTEDMLRFTEYTGSTGVELDVRLTKDKVPVLYHDPDLNIRLVKKGPLLGFINEYTLEQLKTFVRLIHGEQIPTLGEALNVIVRETQLKTVWLDMKEPEALSIVRSLQQEYQNLANQQGRSLQILIGIPSSDIYDAFKSLQGYRDIPSICELDTDQALAIGAKIWAFRWTQGLLEDEVTRMHMQGIKCLVWTLDVPAFTEIYVSQGGRDPAKRFDGILTNYPSITAYYHYVRQNY